MQMRYLQEENATVPERKLIRFKRLQRVEMLGSQAVSTTKGFQKDISSLLGCFITRAMLVDRNAAREPRNPIVTMSSKKKAQPMNCDAVLLGPRDVVCKFAAHPNQCPWHDMESSQCVCFSLI